MTLHLTPEVEARLIELARSNGVSVEAFLERVVMEKPKATTPASSLEELFASVRGLADDIDFSRNPSTARSVDL